MTDEAEAIVVICPVCGLPAGTVGPSCYLDSVGCTRAVMTDEAETLKPCPREPDEAMVKVGAKYCDFSNIASPGAIKFVIGFWRAMYDAAPKSLEIPREIAALRELVELENEREELSKEWNRGHSGYDLKQWASGEYNRRMLDYHERLPLAWAAARSALAMYDQERG